MIGNIKKRTTARNERRQIAVVTVTDTGCGIDPNIVPRFLKSLSQGQLRMNTGWGCSYQKVLYRRMGVSLGPK